MAFTITSTGSQPFLPHIKDLLTMPPGSSSLELPPIWSCTAEQQEFFVLDSSQSQMSVNRAPVIGNGVIVRKGFSYAPIGCSIQLGSEYSDVAGRNVTVFTAHVPGIREPVGRCSFEIIAGFPDCCDYENSTKDVVGVLNLDSWNRHEYRGVGTLLMQAAIEWSYIHGAEGRVGLHSTGEALGFYHKLGFQNGFRDTAMECKIENEIAQARAQQRAPKDLLDGDALLMYLPSHGIERWRQVILQKPVLTFLKRR
jgi:hypothetical protein